MATQNRQKIKTVFKIQFNYVTKKKKKKNKQTNNKKKEQKQKINYVTIQNKLEKYI